MTYLIDMLMNVIYSIAGYITSFFGYLFNAFYTLIAYVCTSIMQWFYYCISWVIILVLYTFDALLTLFVFTLNRVFDGNVFGLVGLSVSAIEDNLDAILAIAPYAKMTAYVLNLDAAQNAFRCFLLFLIVWSSYRWFRVWVRG